MTSNMDIITAIYRTQLKLDQCDESELDRQAVPESGGSGKHSRELLRVYKEKVLVFPFD